MPIVLPQPPTIWHIPRMSEHGRKTFIGWTKIVGSVLWAIYNVQHFTWRTMIPVVAILLNGISGLYQDNPNAVQDIKSGSNYGNGTTIAAG